VAAAIPASIPSLIPSNIVASPSAPEPSTRVSTAPLAIARRASASNKDEDFEVASAVTAESPSNGEEHTALQKKVKHQLTDRQRRAKIKESMDQLKALVPIDSHAKADQATIVSESVDLIKGMKDELSSLRQRIGQLELGKNAGEDPAKKNTNFLPQTYSASPFSAMMASLNGAGVSMWRMGLDGRVLEVNLVFEMITGFSAADVVNRSPCSAPLYGSLNVMPKSFLRYFSGTQSAAISPASQDVPGSPQSVDSGGNSPMEDAMWGQGAATAQRMASAASPLFSHVTISSLPIVPHSELQSFFPFKCKQLESSLPSTSGMSSTSASASASSSLPHGQYLMNHLMSLPPNHVLKLLSRHSTSYGETLESIQTMTLVRRENGQPDYILCLTTPDGRRLVKPTKFLQTFKGKEPTAAAAAGGGDEGKAI
jgi:hypothetical protein